MRLAEGLGRSPALQPSPLYCRDKAASRKQADLQKKNPTLNSPRPELIAGADIYKTREGRVIQDLQRKQSLGMGKQSLSLWW